MQCSFGLTRKVCYHTAGLSDPMDPAVTTTDSLAGETFARLFEAVHEGVYIGAGGRARQLDALRQPVPQADVRFRRRHAGRRGQAVRDRSLRRSAGARAVSRAVAARRCGHRLPAAPASRRSRARVDRGNRARRGRRWLGAARRGVDARRQRAQAPRGPGPRSLSPAAAGRKARRARADHLRRRARAEQSAGDDPDLGRTPLAARGGRADEARARHHPC